MTTPKRIVFTVAVGKPKFAECALGLGRSLRLIGDRTRRVVVTDLPDYPWTRYFDDVLPPDERSDSVYLSKLTALNRTDADQVLFLDADCLAFKRLDPIFTACEGLGFAVQGRYVSAGNWYGSVPQHLTNHSIAAMPQFNGGLIYYERSAETSEFIKVVQAYGRQWDQLGFVWDGMNVADEPCISLAMAKSGFGTLLPDESDFTNSATGLVGKLRMDVRTGTCKFLCRRYELRLAEPYVFHASRYINFLVYWRQLDRLKALEAYEDKHGPGYMPPLHKLGRSIQRRIIKLTRGRFM